MTDKEGNAKLATAKMQTQLDLDEETRDMCLENNILQYVERIDTAICRTYEDVNSIKHRLIRDPDAPDQRRLRFEIHLTGDPTKILEDEKKLYMIFFREIPEEKQDLFTFTYRTP